MDFMRLPKIAISSAISLLVLVSFQRSEALVLLTIDVSNPSAVTFTSTTNVAGQNSVLTSNFDGFTVENFFTATEELNQETVVLGNLTTTAGGGYSYDILQTFNFDANDGVFGPGNDLTIYSFTTAGAQIFNTATRAFTGVATVDFSDEASSLPAGGTVGQIYAGYLKSGNPQYVLIGQWTVIPEPACALLLPLGLIPLCRRRRC
jgi:hypothetical protein